MATQAQIDANRRNAQKSTGPKTPKGKDTVAQNALKHDLLARRFFIGPDQHAEFAAFRDALKNDINPVGALQTALADRIADLHWRLKQAQTLRSSILNTLIEKQLNSPDDLPDLQPSDTPQQIEESLLGATVIADYAADRTLERLSVYEYRIERSLYAAHREYRSLRNFRAKEALITAKHMDTLEDNKYIYDAIQNQDTDHPKSSGESPPNDGWHRLCAADRWQNSPPAKGESPPKARSLFISSPPVKGEYPRSGGGGIKQENFHPINNNQSPILNQTHTNSKLSLSSVLCQSVFICVNLWLKIVNLDLLTPDS